MPTPIRARKRVTKLCASPQDAVIRLHSNMAPVATARRDPRSASQAAGRVQKV